MEISELTLDFGELSRVVRRILKEFDLDPAKLRRVGVSHSAFGTSFG